MAIYPLSARLKILRAHEHLESLEGAIRRWLEPPPYTVTINEDLNRGLYLCRVDMHLSDNIIPALLGDFICNLRSSLEHLAWELAHTSQRRFTDKQLTQIGFPVFERRTDFYEIIRGLFPPAVADIMDDLQPFIRGASFPDDPLWQLHELWNLDKHRFIPVSPTSMSLVFPLCNGKEVIGRMNTFHDHLEVRFPLALVKDCDVKFEPQISIDVVFGEDPTFTVPWLRLREIYDFVRDEAIPPFARFLA